MTSTIPSCIIDNTIALITIALASDTRRVPSIFTDRNVLNRPPFALFFEIVKFIAKENLPRGYQDGVGVVDELVRVLDQIDSAQ